MDLQPWQWALIAVLVVLIVVLFVIRKRQSGG